MLAAFLLLLLALPDGARVLSASGHVTLTWDGEAKKDYLLQVSREGKPLFAGQVRGTQAELDNLTPGLYRWQVSPGSTYHTFILETNSYLAYDGQDSPPTERPSLPGRPGRDGRSLQVTLTAGTPYLTLTVNSQKFYLTPDTTVVLSSRGGRGGDGGPETPPGPQPLDAGGTVIWVPGGVGRPPGPGGRGGAGGRVVVTGPDAQKYLQIHNEGGQGGEPGGVPGPKGLVQWR